MSKDEGNTTSSSTKRTIGRRRIGIIVGAILAFVAFLAGLSQITGVTITGLFHGGQPQGSHSTATVSPSGQNNTPTIVTSATRPPSNHSSTATPTPTATSTPTPTPTPSPTITPTTPPPPPPYNERTANSTSPTFTNYTNAGGTQGQTVPAYTTIQVTCAISGFKVADGNPWWYRIASSPWNNAFYAPADNFCNNGQNCTNLSDGPWVDPNVPMC
ncbi:MAG: hypothetical protein OJF49_002821 [Ktedonobacterales bacterium]|jgi:cytoskeletal protein RodZ|nr:MAG: hypothetical protein OJF49_002821 [Ktedonobacterales bacterium]